MTLARSRLDLVVGRALGTVLVTVRGPLRSDTADRLDRTVGKALAEGPERLVIDLTGVTDLDEAGKDVLRDAYVSAETHQVQLVITSRRKDLLDQIADLA